MSCENSGNSDYLAECEPPVKNLLEYISDKNAALNASLNLLNFINRHVNLSQIKEDDEYLRLNNVLVRTLQKISQ